MIGRLTIPEACACVVLYVITMAMAFYANIGLGAGLTIVSIMAAAVIRVGIERVTK